MTSMNVHVDRLDGATALDGRTQLRDRIETARAAFLHRAGEKIHRAASLATMLKAGQTAEQQATLTELETLAHSLAGTAGSFGYASLSERAELLEDAIVTHALRPKILALVAGMVSAFLEIGLSADL